MKDSCSQSKVDSNQGSHLMLTYSECIYTMPTITIGFPGKCDPVPASVLGLPDHCTPLCSPLPSNWTVSSPGNYLSSPCRLRWLQREKRLFTNSKNSQHRKESHYSHLFGQKQPVGLMQKWFRFEWGLCFGPRSVIANGFWCAMHKITTQGHCCPWKPLGFFFWAAVFS